MPKISAGLLMFRRADSEREVFLAHPGGPYFRKRDAGFWGIPKGLVEEGEDLLEAAIREFEEETGIRPEAPYLPLPTVRYRSSRKWLHAWAFSGDWDPEGGIQSNIVEIEWPPQSGTILPFPEIDRAAWFGSQQAKEYIHPAQLPLLEALATLLDTP